MTEAKADNFSSSELMTVTMMRELKDGELAIMGAVSMLPMCACRASQITHAPNLWYIAGGSGSVSPRQEPLVYSSCDYALLRSDGAINLLDVIAVEGYRIDVFFAGGLQIDKYGNCNLVCVGDYKKPKLRGPGSVGLPFLSRAKRTIIYTMSHNARTLVEKVDFNSGPGFLSGPEAWKAQGLPGQGPSLVVTPLCVMDFDPETKTMRLKSLNPGVALEQVVENTGFELVIPPDLPTTQPPTELELAAIRQVDRSGILRH